MARSKIVNTFPEPQSQGRERSTIDLETFGGPLGRERTVIELQPNFIQRISRGGSMSRRQLDTGRYGDIRAEDLFPGSIDTIHIKFASITTALIEDLAVTTAKIAALAVTDAKIFSLDAGKITAGLLNVERLNITGIILQSFTWTNNSPGAGSVAWSAGTITYKGITYSISSGNTSNRYIYWAFGGTSFSSSATLPTLTDNDFMIALNESGTHDLYFNSPTPPVQGVDTDHLRNLAITNAKINDLSADKITTGTLDAGSVTISSDDGKMTLAGNTLQIKNASDVIQVTLGKYDGTNYGLAIGTTPASPDILIDSSSMQINTTNYVNFKGSKCLFQNSGGSLSSLIGYIINNFTVQGDSTNGLNLFGNGGNISLGETSGSYGGGSKVVFIPNRSAAPSSNPTGGGILYAESGALKWRGSSGTVTTIAIA